jgi:hypothetical protein
LEDRLLTERDVACIIARSTRTVRHFRKSGGPFDRVAGSYRDNIVVFAHMTSHT